MSDRTVVGLLKEYKEEWGLALFGLHTHEIIKLQIEALSIDSRIAHGVAALSIAIMWGLSDKVSLDFNEDKKFWK